MTREKSRHLVDELRYRSLLKGRIVTDEEYRAVIEYFELELTKDSNGNNSGLNGSVELMGDDYMRNFIAEHFSEITRVLSNMETRSSRPYLRVEEGGKHGSRRRTDNR